MKKNIAFCLDGNYLELMLVALHSLLSNNENVVVHIVKIDDFSEDKVLNIVRHFGGEVKFYNYEINLPPKGRFSKAMFGRFFLGELIGVDRILYLDCDVIVTGSLDALFGEKFVGSYLIAAAEDAPSVMIDSIKSRLNIFDYYNSGVLLIENSEKLRLLFKECVEYIQSGKNLVFPDQDAINVIFSGKIKRLDCKYNYTKVEQAEELPLIIHYAHEKPWSSYSNHGYKKAYYDEIARGGRFGLSPFILSYGVLDGFLTILKKVIKSLGMFDLIQRYRWRK